WSGIVNENDLCHLNGFPGPLRKTLGIWAEEVEGLHDHDRNGIVMTPGNALGLAGSFEVHEICELIHSEGADILGQYKEDFYAGRPALTVNALGKGKAYYLAARVNDPAFYDGLYGKLVSDAGVRRAMDIELPGGVSAQLRSDGEHDFVFLLNFSGEERTLELDQAYTDAETGEPVLMKLTLPVYASRVLKRSSGR
ncbi:beta-galactosidase trimerization domain-containing protein, partial [Paenibacillus sepulcri]|nr:beta-galactosidase trimerization domain-containing protein [Paenibacillus sepulcri]